MSRRKPITFETEWTDADTDLPGAEQITKGGRHHMAEFLDRKHGENEERRARYRREYPDGVPPAQYRESGRTWKSSSRIRVPSEAFRQGWTRIRWNQ